MRLVSFGERGKERAGVFLPAGSNEGGTSTSSSNRNIVALQDLDPALPDSVLGVLQAGLLPRIHQLLTSTTLRGQSHERLRLGAPVLKPGKIICIGLNYKGHATEQNKPWPEKPLLFAKAGTALCGAHDDIELPVEDCQVDYEVELAVIIGTGGRRIPVAAAMSHIAGYCTANDVSARRWQQGDGQWFRAKSSDTFFPCGPALITADEIADPRALRLTTTIAGTVLQDAMASDLIHDIPALIAYISRDITLEPGDIISTGTPAGVGCYRTPPRFLVPGDVVECAITGPGIHCVLSNRVVKAKA